MDHKTETVKRQTFFGMCTYWFFLSFLFYNSSATNNIISAKDHASVQIPIAEVTGR